jgi:hypothetical protein
MKRLAMRKAALACALLALVHPTCNQAIMTAPSGSTITLSANPTSISSDGGVSVISALVIEPAGTVVSDGTVVQFFTDLGVIDEQGKTNDGVARVNLRANGRSGVAHITAFSGGEAVPAPSPSASPATGAAQATSAGVEVTIGNASAAFIIVGASPPRIRLSVSRSTQITATVLDKDGNPISGVPVFFDVIAGASTNFLDSAGVPRFTDNNGQAFDVLRTRNTGAGTATVQAQAPGAAGLIKGTTIVEIVLN